MRLPRTLKGILTLNFAIAAVLPLAVIGVITFIVLSESIKEIVKQNDYLLAQTLSSEVESYLGAGLQTINEISSFVSRGNISGTDTINKYLDMINENHPMFDELEILDLSLIHI